MKQVTQLTVILMLVWAGAANTFSQKPPPPPPGPGSIVVPHVSKPETLAEKAKHTDMSCPIKGTFSVHLKKVGGMVMDKDITVAGADGRFCQSPADQLYCEKNNPTPNIPCKQIDLLPRGISCNLTFHDFVGQDHSVSLGGWDFINSGSSIYQTVYTCDRAYKMDSCRYWYQESAITKFVNAGFLSVDRKISGQISV